MLYERNRQTELLIDLNAMEHNYQEIQKKVPNKRILPVLKASGYGIGVKTVKAFIDKMNLNMIATALVDEGVVLRAGLEYTGEIIVLNQPAKEDIPNIIQNAITTGVCYIEFVEELNKEAEKQGCIAKVHVEIETGMGRTGVQLEKLQNFIAKVKKLNHIKVEGIYSHFATSDTDIKFAQKQIAIFQEAVKQITEQIDTIAYVHIGNSGGILQLPNLPGNMVRPGILLYGYLPDENLKGEIDLRPCCVLKSRISFLKEVELGTSISYGRTYVTNKKTRVANVPIGYADGIRRSLSNKGHVVINGQLAPIIGTVCMDSFMIDVTNIENVKIGNEVFIWDNKNITVEDIAKECGTINYEILSTISNRVIRVSVLGTGSKRDTFA